MICIVQCADNTLIIIPVDPTQLMNLKKVLKDLSALTSINVNYDKSFLVPNNINEDKVVELANILECKKEVMPFTYLGLPMGTTRPKVDDLMPMVIRLDKRLFEIASMLTYPCLANFCYVLYQNAFLYIRSLRKIWKRFSIVWRRHK